MNPKAARSFLQAYLIPRLLYGLEAMILTSKQIDQLETYFRSILKQIQSLPDNVSKSAPYILMGICSIKATYNKNLVSLMATALGDVSTRELAEHCYATKSPSSSSWFTYVQKRLSKYPFASPGVSQWEYGCTKMGRSNEESHQRHMGQQPDKVCSRLLEYPLSGVPE